MPVLEISEKIKRLKDDLGDQLCIMGHHYQNDEIAQHCDIMGDSLELARKISDISAKYIVFCGVYFMGETAALLAKPGQRVYLPEKNADCMMSRMATAKMAKNVLKSLRHVSGRIIPVAYVNTMLELKDVVGEFGGAVCTSANADKILAWALNNSDAVLFLPDKNLGKNTAKKLGIPDTKHVVLRLNQKGLREQPKEAKLYLWPGSCAIHGKFTGSYLQNLKNKNSDAIFIAHPECQREIISQCDEVGSTSFIIKSVEKLSSQNPGQKVFIGTEENLVKRLAKQYKSALGIQPFGSALCKHMAATTPEKLLNCLVEIKENRAEPMAISPAMTANARRAIEKMLQITA